MEQGTAEAGGGGGLDLSALLGGLGQEGGPDLSSLLEMVKGSGQSDRQDPRGEPPGGGMDFASLLGMLGGLGGAGPDSGDSADSSDSGGGPGEEGLPAFDPALLITFRRAMKALREPDRNIQLLQALRPFLEPERQKKVDEAIKFLHLIKLAPLLQGLTDSP